MRQAFPTRRLRYLADVNPPVPGHVRLDPEAEYRLLPMEAIHEFSPPDTGYKRPALELLSGYSYIEPTDVAYAKVTPCFENGKGLVGADLEEPVFATTEVTVLRPRDGVNQRFLSYVVQSATFRNPAISSMTGAGGLKRVSDSYIKDLHLPAPSIYEQQQIADYLDHETAEIDAFIADQKSLSELLQERWHSLLIHTVQIGAQGAARLCSTEVAEWPYVPHRWEKMRLKSTILDSQNGSWGSEPGVDSVTRRCIRVADFDKNSGRIHSANETERSYPLSQIKNLELQSGDLIIEKSGGGPTTPVGNTVLYDAPGGDMFSNFVARIRLRSNISPLFAVYLHRSLYLNQVTQRSIKQTTGIQNLDADSYFNETIFLPSLEEQKSIGRSIEENRIETETSLQVIEKATDLARERRAALITAAVTGQIDVTARNKPAAEQLEDDVAQGLQREYA